MLKILAGTTQFESVDGEVRECEEQKGKTRKEAAALRDAKGNSV